MKLWILVLFSFMYTQKRNVLKRFCNCWGCPHPVPECPSLNPILTPYFSFLLLDAFGDSKYLGSYHSCARPQLSSWLLTWAWPNPTSAIVGLGGVNQLMGELCVCVSL